VRDPGPEERPGRPPEATDGEAPAEAAVPPRGALGVDVLMATFNSARDLDESLEAMYRCVPVHRLIVVDRESTDGTAEIAHRWGAEVYRENVGLGLARTVSVARAETDLVLFVDSDVIVRRRDFLDIARRELDDPRTGAVVGSAVGHAFHYGLPFGLTLLRRELAREVPVPPDAQGYETYYFRRELRRRRLRVRYIPDAMEHRSAYRGATWPEWQGAQLRLAAGWDLRELAYAGVVVLLIHLNSRRPRDILYSPVFYLKLLRGFLAPARWRLRDRRLLAPDPRAGSSRTA
jgi:glycosyltransferase involved in cell wall biosynthesis